MIESIGWRNDNCSKTLREEEKLSWSDPWLQSIDLEYHNIVPESGLYYELVRQGAMRRVVTEGRDQARHLCARRRIPELTFAADRSRALTPRSNRSSGTRSFSPMDSQDMAGPSGAAK